MNIDDIMDRCNYEHEMSKQMEQQDMVDLNDKGALASDSAKNKEMLLGNFKLKINRKLSKMRKIECFSGDAMIFFLHKKRNFIEKINR